jgi:hypothetical protein
MLDTLPFATVQITQSMLPTAQLELVRSRAQSGAFAELESLLWFRENVDDWRKEQVLMQAYKEYAEAMLISSDTLRRKMATVRAYPAEKLVLWISKGIGFDHIETANTLAELAKKDPAQLLDEAVELGNEHGKTMTVDELTVFALGEQKRDPALFRVNTLLSRLGRFPDLLKWDGEKRAKFTVWLDAGREFFS